MLYIYSKQVIEHEKNIKKQCLLHETLTEITTV